MIEPDDHSILLLVVARVVGCNTDGDTSRERRLDSGVYLPDLT
jgi:hypothetical protein